MFYWALSHPFLPWTCSSLERLDAELAAEVAALAGEGPTEGELRRFKKVGAVARAGLAGWFCLLAKRMHAECVAGRRV